MSLNLRYPNITGSTDKEQLSQIKSYLHQLVEQLNYALPSTGTGDGTAQVPTSYEVQGGAMSYYELRSLIIQQIQEVERLFDKLAAQIEAELPLKIEQGILQAKEQGQFDLTEEEINDVANRAAGRITFTLDEEGNLYYEVEE